MFKLNLQVLMCGKITVYLNVQGGGELVHSNIHVITYIRYNMESQACKTEFTCLKLNLRISISHGS
jgi:hypothetical protein